MKSKIFIFAAILVAIVESAPSRTKKIKSIRNQRQRGAPRILGGEEALLHEFPYQVALYTTKWHWYWYWLNGALITDKWIVTTAWAVYQLPENAFAVLGAHSLNEVESSQQTVDIDQKIIHEDYQSDQFNNIGLLRLKTAAVLNKYVGTINLVPSNVGDLIGSRLKITSYGYKTSTTASDTLRFVVVKGISSSVCRKERGISIDECSMCTDTSEGRGGCYWDYGAPLVDVNSGRLAGLLTLHGACNSPPIPDVFTRISYFNKWIAGKIN